MSFELEMHDLNVSVLFLCTETDANEKFYVLSLLVKLKNSISTTDHLGSLIKIAVMCNPVYPQHT